MECKESNKAYHEDYTHVGSTMLSEFRSSPLRFHGLYVTREIQRDAPTSELVLGSIVHCILAGTPIEEEFLVATGCNSRQGKKWDEYEYEASEMGMVPVLPSQLTNGILLADKILKNPIAKPLFEADGICEQSIRFESQGVLCKVKPDRLVTDPRYDVLICADIKTTSADSIQDFEKAAWNYEYHCSSAMYLEGVNSVKEYAEQTPCFVFVVVFKRPPNEVAVLAVEPDSSFYRLGLRTHHETLSRLKWARENNNWNISGMDDGHEISKSGFNRIQSIHTPAWVRE